MDPKIVWLFIFVILYWGYCIFWGIKGAIAAKTASDYMVAGRSNLCGFSSLLQQQHPFQVGHLWGIPV